MTIDPIIGTPPAGDLRLLMASFPTGVSVVTALGESAVPRGMTCTSLCSVSLDPPVLLVCLRSDSPTREAVASSSRFAVNLLHARSRQIAHMFGSGRADRFDLIQWRHGDGAAGPHLVADAHTVADCSVMATHVVGTHTVVMGLVERVTALREQHPLLYGLRRYATWPDSPEPA
ncbi:MULTISPECIES: flavin reductase family protein [unclassified Actinoplanes]|uniref:flavin reductase family protein n=1 Tax=unclassified Actinoplanes TaxID=2626549 RepID=UPI0002DC5FC9|nr:MULTISPECIES: flavin reductase family protein [unclassified Actinoplanes]